MSINKQYYKTKPYCKVTLKISPSIAGSAREVHVLGDFNGWQPQANPMRALNDGSFTADIKLPVGKAYQFRYLIDGSRWENDPEADDYIPNNVSGDTNSVLLV